jgi:hypothetical protein
LLTRCAFVFKYKTDNAIGDLINNFWDEFDCFRNKKKGYANRNFIWENQDIRHGDSYLWHKKNSLKFTDILGSFACRVCSKILGIGAAERSWGDVKHLKTNKRSHLSGEKVKKQATIFGATCIEQAQIRKSLKTNDSTLIPYRFLMDEDFDDMFDMLKQEKEPSKKTARDFLNWEEEWEIEAVRKRDPVNDARLLKKYGGLKLFDVDHNMIHAIDEKSLTWTKLRRDGGGYCCVTYNENYEQSDPKKEENVDHWEINDDLRYCIDYYYTKYPSVEINIIQNTKIVETSEDKKGASNENDESDSD